MATPLVRGRVLAVDDDPSILETVQAILELEGYTVQAAAHGAEALQVASAQAPCVILLDMRMPVMDGWEFVRRYRSAPGPHAPVVVMTAAENAQRWCDEVGGEACLPKPFDLDELIDLVIRFCGPAA